MANSIDRWPPIYDFDDLARQVKLLAGSEAIEYNFYSNEQIGGRRSPLICQGDIVDLGSKIPYIDETGSPRVEISDDKFWLVTGNTCDFTRTIEEARYTQVVPTVNLGPTSDLCPQTLQDLRSYNQFRSFYLPPIQSSGDAFVADFLRPVSVDKRALKPSMILARLSYMSWVLLHCCLVRFLARDDGRMDNNK